jgi:hypothetical protein
MTNLISLNYQGVAVRFSIAPNELGWRMNSNILKPLAFWLRRSLCCSSCGTWTFIKLL